jgi:hypothetical protein
VGLVLGHGLGCRRGAVEVDDDDEQGRSAATASTLGFFFSCHVHFLRYSLASAVELSPQKR